jgi:hypothetical protein
MRRPAEISGSSLTGPEQFLHEVVEPCRPLVIRGLVSHWPVVAAGETPDGLRRYLARFDRSSEAEAFFGPPGIAGKYYYADGLNGFNFARRRMRLAAALDAMIAGLDRPGSDTIYMGSLPVEDYLPGFAGENVMPLISVSPRIWLGHACDISAHYDTADNLACVVAGSRRFTLYAPEWIAGLYPGPIDNTMAGQPVSLAASSPPDDVKFPRFRDIRDQALVADLEPGDALYLPKLWWHQVVSRGALNGLVNYWWDAFAAGPDAPHTSMLLAMIAIAERPLPERRAWKALFDHYVFREQGHPLAHLPARQHGVLGPLKENYGRVRARVMQTLRGG